METAIVDVTLVRQPGEGKKYGSIKGASDDWWPVKIDRLREFEAGNKYELAFTKSDTGFKNIIGVKKIVPQAAQQVNYTQRPDARREGETFTEPHRNGATLTTAAAQTKPQAQQQNGYYKPTSPRDAKRMALCKWTEAFILTGRVERSKESVVETIMMLSDAYDETVGTDD
jgi:hypothetical protein